MKKLMKKLAAAVMAAVITASAMVIPTTTASAAGVFDGAPKMEELEYYSRNFEHNEVFYYKIVLPKSGKLTLRCGEAVGSGHTKLAVMDSKANILHGYDNIGNGWGDIYDLEKGTYYAAIRVSEHTDYYIKDFYYTFTPDQKPTISLKLTVTKGDTIQLGSIVENYDGKVTWETTKKSVATVSTKGKVTAKKKGTATIRAKLDSGEYVQIKIVVKNPTKK